MPDLLLSGANFVDGHELGGPLSSTEAEVKLAAQAASRAFPIYSKTTPQQRAAFLNAIADNIDAVGDAITETAHAETALPAARLIGERGRTVKQLRMFADLILEGSWVDARIDNGEGKPDLRRMLVPIGPVAVFGASNFPLAYSVAGGDTASALAAGCPVVVKAHPAHPKTSEIVARAIVAAAQTTGMPSGTFGMVHGAVDAGVWLASQPEIRAIGFTGSLKGGRALFDLAASRERPIPVYAEMGSVNPIVFLPGALDERLEELAKGYADSLTLGVGQFCTNPGIVVGLDTLTFEAFVSRVSDHLLGVPKGTMLHDGIAKAYETGVAKRDEDPRLTKRADAPGSAFHEVDAATFLGNPDLQEELFGPAAIAVKCATEHDLVKVVRALEGQLTATVHYGSTDADLVSTVLGELTAIAGRVIANGFPTGVEVCPSMQHGGPYPATTDGRTTSVGTAAILRFARPVAYQGVPSALLPIELQDGNPAGIFRLVNGTLGKA